MDNDYEERHSVTTTLFPQIDTLGLFLDGDWRDRPASEWAIKKSGTLQAKMEAFKSEVAHRRPIFVSHDEIPMHQLLSFANEAFGYDGWSTQVVETVVRAEQCQQDDQGVERYSLVIESTVRVVLKDGTYHEEAGRGYAENMPFKSVSFSKAKKESVTDAVKNCLKGFGELVLEHEEKMKKGYYTTSGIFN